MLTLTFIGIAAECRVAATGTPLHILALIRDTSGEAGVPGPTTTGRALISIEAAMGKREQGVHDDNYNQAFTNCAKAWAIWGTQLDGVAKAGTADAKPRQLLAILAEQAVATTWALAKQQAAKERDEQDAPVAPQHGYDDIPDTNNGSNGHDQFPAVTAALGKVTAAVKQALEDGAPSAQDQTTIVRECQEFVSTTLKARDRAAEPEQDEEHLFFELHGAEPTEPPRKRRIKGKTRIEEQERPPTAPPAPMPELPLYALGARAPTIPKRHRRRGHGWGKRNGKFTIFYGNVNRYTEKAEEYFEVVGSDTVLYGEHHLRGKELSKSAGEIASKGWQLSASEARASEDSVTGTYGGTFAAVRSHILNSPLHDDEPCGRGVARTKDRDITGRTIHLAGGDIIVFSAYARGGELHEIIKVIRKNTGNGRIPFILLADFNVPYEALKDEEWIADLAAVAVAPSGCTTTCHQGKGSLIDFMIISDQLLGYIISFVAITDVPWGPHDGLMLTLARNPKASMSRLAPPEPRKLRPDKEAAGTSPLSWEEAEAEATEYVEGNSIDFPAEVVEAAAKLGTAATSAALTRSYRIWARANALQALAARGIAKDSAEAQSILHTAEAYKPKMVQARAPNRPNDLQLLAGSAGTSRCRTWATLRALAGKLKAAANIDPDGVDAWKGRANLAKYMGSDSPSAAQALASSGSKDAAAARFAVHRAIIGKPEDIEKAIECLTRIEKQERKRFRAKDTAEWQSFVRKALQEKQGVLHKWANAPNKPKADVTAKNLHSGTDILAQHAKDWTAVWDGYNEEACAASWEAVKELRRRAMADRGAALEHLTLPNLDNALRRFKANTGVGADFVYIQDMIRSTNEAKEAWLKMARKIINALSWPLQALTVLLRLIGKKTGGTRTVATASSIYRVILAVIAGDVREWDQKVAMIGGTAKRGANAALETIDKHASLELAAADGTTTCVIFWDGEKFFDRLGVATTIRSCEEKEFPKAALTLGMQVHRAPRILLDGKEASHTVNQTGRSILPGCTLSTSLARARVKDACEGANLPKDSTNFAHVDDVAQYMYHPNKEMLKSNAIRQGTSMARSLMANDVVVSTKTVVVSSKPGVAKAVAQGITRNIGIDIKSAGYNADIGIQTAGGARRQVRGQRARIVGTRVRCKRIRRLHSITKKAAKLTRVGAVPMASYGVEAQGASPAMTRDMRSALLASIQTGGKRSCTTSSLWWKLGAKFDPAVFLPTKQVSAFVNIFKKANGKRRAKIRDLWTNLVPTALDANNRWARVSGPIHATVATLCDLGWDVTNFREWVSPNGKPFSVLTATKNVGPLLEEVRAGASLRAWSTASHHCLGQGLEKGEPGLDIARSAKAKFIKEGNYDEAKAVDLLVCGACFASKTQGTCPCGAPDGPQHRYWDCSRLQELDNAEFKKGKWLKTVIFKPNSHLEFECLWGRGLLPANWLPEREEGRMSPTETLTAKENFALAKDTFLDGSGGDPISHEVLRQRGGGTADEQ